MSVRSLLRVMCQTQNGSTVTVDMMHSYSSVMELPFKNNNILVPFLLSMGNIIHSKSCLISINPLYNIEWKLHSPSHSILSMSIIKSLQQLNRHWCSRHGDQLIKKTNCAKNQQCFDRLWYLKTTSVIDIRHTTLFHKFLLSVVLQMNY